MDMVNLFLPSLNTTGVGVVMMGGASLSLYQWLL
jgi:hypothetical protein